MFYKCKYFDIRELVPAETYMLHRDSCWQFFHPLALNMLDTIRQFFGRIVIVNDWSFGGSMQYRGFRPISCNIGVDYSQHRLGNGFDLDVTDMSANEVRNAILAHKDSIFQMVNCIEDGISWVHVDCRNIPDDQRILIIQP